MRDHARSRCSSLCVQTVRQRAGPTAALSARQALPRFARQTANPAGRNRLRRARARARTRETDRFSRFPRPTRQNPNAQMAKTPPKMSAPPGPRVGRLRLYLIGSKPPAGGRSLFERVVSPQWSIRVALCAHWEYGTRLMVDWRASNDAAVVLAALARFIRLSRRQRSARVNWPKQPFVLDPTPPAHLPRRRCG